MTARVNAGELLDRAAVRAVAEAHPRLQSFMRTISERSRRGDRHAAGLMEHIITRVATDIGELFVTGGLQRLEKIHVLRENVAAILDNVLEGQELPHGVSAQSLGRYFDELSTEMRELSRPRESIVGDQPLDLYHDAAEYAERLVREFEGVTAAAGGRHVEPMGAVHDAFKGLSEQQQEAVKRAAELEPRAAWRVVASETEAVLAEGLADLEARLGGRLRPQELADLRAGLAEMGKARNKGLMVDQVRLGEALTRIPDPDLRAVVTAGADVWIIQQVAMHNPQALAELWANFKATGRGVADAGAFRAYVRHEMVTFGRAVPAEYTAAFSLSSVEQFLKGPDANPRVGGTDLVGVTHADLVWLVDDKSHRTPSVSSVTALTDNLAQNLAKDAAEFRAAIARLRREDPGFVPDPKVIYAIQRIEAVANAIADIERRAEPRARPALIRRTLESSGIRMKVTSAMGEVRELSDALRELGLQYQPTGIQPRLPRPGGG
jgi:hypothetical protein